MHLRSKLCLPSTLIVEKTEQSDYSIVNRTGKYASISTDRTVPSVNIEKKKAAVSWVDIVMRNAGSTTSTERVATNQTRNKLFREEIILSKQSSVKV